MNADPTLSDLLSEGQKTNEELADMFDLSEEHVKQIRVKHDELVTDSDVTDKQYIAWCEQVDKAYPYSV